MSWMSRPRGCGAPLKILDLVCVRFARQLRIDLGQFGLVFGFARVEGHALVATGNPGVGRAVADERRAGAEFSRGDRGPGLVHQRGGHQERVLRVGRRLRIGTDRADGIVELHHLQAKDVDRGVSSVDPRDHLLLLGRVRCIVPARS
jgi:hypothetical protein